MLCFPAMIFVHVVRMLCTVITQRLILGLAGWCTTENTKSFVHCPGQAPLNNDLFIKTYRKLKSYPKTGVSLAGHPMAPNKGTFNMSSLNKKMKTTMIKYSE